MKQQQYDEISELYDIFIPEPNGIIDFYKDFVSVNNDVLDLGCGTGRLSFALAEKGANVTSIDISPGMIDKAKNKLKDMPSISDRIHFVVSEATTFRTEKKFDFIFLSGGVFEYLLTPLQQEKALSNIKSLLKENGTLVFDIVTPPVILPYSKRISDGGNPVADGEESSTKEYKVNSWDVVRADHFKQIVEVVCHFEVLDNSDKIVDKKEFKFLSRYTLPPEMKHLLEKEGFTVNNFYGDYHKSPFGRNSEFMIYQCTI
ncbi:class I SAM-dependent methyltransferase [Metabacillus idriensis]|uniref:class I SAM-dependent methyltransferase n=1 Tax=Metabacillus idriensis TaxID=324768 RepID=UPI001749C515|nr:class I SAM-dependent methyltransferase [Metabacillus idriensis]